MIAHSNILWNSHTFPKPAGVTFYCDAMSKAPKCMEIFHQGKSALTMYSLYLNVII